MSNPGHSSFNWSTYCGHGEDLTSWAGHDFGHCFEQLVILTSVHAILAIISVYHVGRRRTTLRGTSLYVSWMWFLVLRFICVLGLVISPVLQVLITTFVERTLPSIADGVVVGVTFLSWSLHLLYVWNVRYLHTNSLRGPLSAVLAVVLSLVASGIHVHTVILRHLSGSEHHNKTEEFSTYINAGLCLVYLVSCIPNKQRIYHSGFAFSINDSEEEPLNRDRIRNYGLRDRDRETFVAEKHVNCLSWLTFHWVQKLMSKGAALRLKTIEDLYLLPDRLNTRRIDRMFEEKIERYASDSNHSVNTHLAASGDKSLRNYAENPSLNSPGSYQSLNEEGYDSDVSHREDQPLLNQQQETNRPIQVEEHNVGLFKTLNKAFGLEYYTLGFLKLLADCFGFAGPVLLNYLVGFIESGSDNSYRGYLYALGLFLSTFFGTICSTQFDYNVQVVAYKIRAALITTVYRKSLSVSGVVQSKFTTGEIVNFMSTDTDRILNFCSSFHAFWSLPFQIGISLFLLYQQVGLAFLAGLAFAIVLIPINKLIANKIGKLSKSMMAYKDERVKLMGELLTGIRVIKFYAWETNFAEKINNFRKNELKCLKGRKYLDAACVYFWATTPVLISILTFGTYVLMGNQLTAAKVFTSLSLFLMLISPLNAFPWVINGLVEAWVSLKRVEGFFTLKDNKLSEYYTMRALTEDRPDVVIEMKDASFSWQKSGQNGEDNNFIDRSDEENSSQSSATSQTRTQDLCDVSLQVLKGQFVGIVGKVGSGKSSLLNAIIGEMHRYEGSVHVADLEQGFAYVGQEPWIQHATIRDNILFGHPFESQRYEHVLESCALIEDLKIMPAGDLTEVGENGVTLSGGQKARVALARAVYQGKKVYLLDDPLSAVDAHVAQHLFTYCVTGILKHTTRIMCTHHIKYLIHADWVIVMEDGRIKEAGPPSSVLSHIYLPDEGRREGKHVEEESLKEEREEEESHETLVKEEEREKGTVKGHVYKAYWVAVGTCLSPLVLLALFLMQGSRNVSDWWLSYWISHSQDDKTGQPTDVLHLALDETIYPWLNDSIPETNLTWGYDNLNFYMGVYGGLAAANSFFTLLRAFLFAYGGIQAATVIHVKLLSAVLKAPLSFFESTPIGRVLNRFSSDLYAVDDSLPFILNIFLAQAYGIFGTLIITCYGLPWFALCLIPLVFIYYKIQNYYRHTSRELKRFSSVSLSPIYAHFSETITGLPTIKAMRHQHRFRNENLTRLDVNQRAQYATQLSARWLDFRLRMMGVVMVTCIAFIAVVKHQLTTIDAGLVGLAISYSLSVTNLLGGVVMFFTETEKEFVSVERCQHYINSTPTERWDGSLFAPSSWPTEGAVEFDSVCLRYSTMSNNALDFVSFKTKPGEKVGIVGRSGAGKSSLFLALFRIMELGHGRILVDDVDIRMLDLTELRSTFAIIPQDPFLFSGSIRINLDPKSVHPDHELVSALERCHMRSVVERMGGLDAKVSQRGREFSVGQRQLLCLARAMLTKAKVLCIDEATASVDLDTDAVIQSTIRHEFQHSTVLTIAHRVNTVLDSQRVLVMSEGHVAEFAPPDELLSDPSSLFYHLVYQTG